MWRSSPNEKRPDPTNIAWYPLLRRTMLPRLAESRSGLTIYRPVEGTRHDRDHAESTGARLGCLWIDPKRPERLHRLRRFAPIRAIYRKLRLRQTPEMYPKARSARARNSWDLIARQRLSALCSEKTTARYVPHERRSELSRPKHRKPKRCLCVRKTEALPRLMLTVELLALLVNIYLALKR